MTRVSFHRLAERELNDAALYYESESPGLGIKSIDEIDGHIERIVRNPRAGEKVRKRGSSLHSPKVSLWNFLFREGSRYSDSGNHESETQTELLGRPILNRLPNKGIAAAR